MSDVETTSAKVISKQELSNLVSMHASFLGKTGSGKTELAKALFQSKPYSAIFFNTMRLRDVKGTYLQDSNTLDTLLYNDTFFNKKFKAVISPNIGEKSKDFSKRIVPILDKINTLQDVKYAKNKESILYIFIDEVQELTKVSEFNEIINTISLTGRNKKLFLVLVSQRAVNVDKNNITQSDTFIGFIEPHDYRYWKNLNVIVPPIKQFSYEFFYLNKEQLIKLQL